MKGKLLWYFLFMVVALLLGRIIIKVGAIESELRQLESANVEIVTINHLEEVALSQGQEAFKNKASGNGNALESHEKLIISTGEFPPFVYLENEQLSGISVEVISAILDQMKVKYEIIVEPWNRGQYELTSGSRFGVFPYVETKERLRNFTFSKPFYSTELNNNFFIAYGKDDLALKAIKTWEDINDYKIGGVYGYYYLDEFATRGITLDLSATELECLQKLRDGKIDLAVFNPLVVKFLTEKYMSQEAEKFGITDFQMNPEALGDCLMLNNKDPWSADFLVEFNQVLKLLEDDGTISKILEKYK